MITFDELFAGLAGERIPGGCDMCDAFQTVELVLPGVGSMTIHHDDDCTVLRQESLRRRRLPDGGRAKC